MALTATIACAATYAAEEVFIPKVFESLPQAFDVDLERNLVLYATYNKLHAYDLESGRQRWWKPLLQENTHYFASFGKDYAVMARDEEFLVLDKETGRELWKEYSGRLRTYHYAAIIPQTNWIRWRNENNIIYYNVAERKEYRALENMALKPIIPPVGNRVLYGFKEADWSEPPTKMEVYFWEAGASAPEKMYTIESPGKLYVEDIFGNELLTVNHLSDNESEDIQRVYNLDTGEAMREFNRFAFNISRETFLWLPRNRNFYFWKDEDENLLHRFDVKTGEIVSEDFPEDHILWWDMGRRYMGIYESTNGLWWFATRDDDRNFWLLPFNHDATPRKLLEGKRFLPVSARDIKEIAPPCLHAEINNKFTSIYRLEELEKIVERPGTMGVSNADKTVIATRVREDKAVTTHLFRDNEETPIFKVKGEPVAFSPDGRYLVVEAQKSRPAVQEKDDTTLITQEDLKTFAYIIEVETQQVVAQSESYRYSKVADFSPNTHYFVFHSLGGLKLMDIASGFTEKILSIPGAERVYVDHLCFSPDSKRLLVSRFGQAEVFDTSTGTHIVTLKETERFLKRRGSNEDFLSRLGTMAGDFVGRHTNLLKFLPPIRASFAKDGAQVITIAENMLIRIWDTETGRLIRTIDPKLPEQRDEKYGSINNAIVLSGNGAYALTYNRDGFDTGTLWDLEKGVKIRCYTFLGMHIEHAAVSKDGTEVYAMINGDLHYLSGAKRNN